MSNAHLDNSSGVGADLEGDLAALADGSMAPERRSEALARVHSSPASIAALAEQGRVVALVRSIDVRAPARLHRRVQALIHMQRTVGETAVEDRRQRPGGPPTSQAAQARRTLRGDRANG